MLGCLPKKEITCCAIVLLERYSIISDLILGVLSNLKHMPQGFLF